MRAIHPTDGSPKGRQDRQIKTPVLIRLSDGRDRQTLIPECASRCKSGRNHTDVGPIAGDDH
jgi:hypothetical protein